MPCAIDCNLSSPCDPTTEDGDSSRITDAGALCHQANSAIVGGWSATRKLVFVKLSTWTVCRHLGQVERQTPEIPSSRRSAFCNLWRLGNREKVSAVPPGSPMTARHSFPLLDRCASP